MKSKVALSDSATEFIVLVSVQIFVNELQYLRSFYVSFMYLSMPLLVIALCYKRVPCISKSLTVFCEHLCHAPIMVIKVHLGLGICSRVFEHIHNRDMIYYNCRLAASFSYQMASKF